MYPAKPDHGLLLLEPLQWKGKSVPLLQVKLHGQQWVSLELLGGSTRFSSSLCCHTWPLPGPLLPPVWPLPAQVCPLPFPPPCPQKPNCWMARALLAVFWLPGWHKYALWNARGEVGPLSIRCVHLTPKWSIHRCWGYDGTAQGAGQYHYGHCDIEVMSPRPCYCQSLLQL